MLVMFISLCCFVCLFFMIARKEAANNTKVTKSSEETNEDPSAKQPLKIVFDTKESSDINTAGGYFNKWK